MSSMQIRSARMILRIALLVLSSTRCRLIKAPRVSRENHWTWQPCPIAAWPSASRRVLLWLSSRFLGRLSGVGSFEEAVDAAGDVALEAPCDFAWGSTFGGSPGDVGAGLCVE